MFPSALCLLADRCQKACFESLTFGVHYTTVGHYSEIECTRKMFSLVSFSFWEQILDCPLPPGSTCEHILRMIMMCCFSWLFQLLQEHTKGTHTNFYSLPFPLCRQSRSDENESGCVSFGVTCPSAGAQLVLSGQAVPGSREHFPRKPGLFSPCIHTLSHSAIPPVINMS